MKIPKIDKYILKKLNLFLKARILKKRYTVINKGPIKGFKWVNLIDLYRYSLGTHEEALTNHLYNTLQPNSVFYDIGANVGYYSVIAGNFIKTGKVYAFEPIPAARKLMLEHLNINKISRVEVMNYGVSDKKKSIIFSNSDHLSANSYIDGAVLNKTDVLKVNCISIDDGIRDLNLTPPTIIKIDVEGAEYDVLNGAKNTIKKYKPIIFLATHDLIVNNITKLCTDLLTGLNYKVTSTTDLKESEGQYDFYCEPNLY